MYPDGHVPELSIIIPTYNQANLTIRCMSSIRQYTTTPYEIVWVDNASRPDQLRLVKSQATKPRVHTKCVSFNKNTGFVKAVNAGLKQAAGKYIVILNNDTEVSYRWDQKLLQPLRTDPKVGAVGPITQSKIAWQESKAASTRFGIKIPIFSGTIDKYSRELDRLHSGRYVDIGDIPLAFFCVALRKSTFDLIGNMDEAFGLGFGDDDEYCFRLRANKFQNILSIGTFVYHHHRTTFKAMGANIDEMRRKNIKILKAKKKTYVPVVQ